MAEYTVKEFLMEKGRRLLQIGLQNLILLQPVKSRQLFTDWSKAIFQMFGLSAAAFFEYKIGFGPGYRIYFGQDGKTFIILLCGGTKKTQQKDIDRARDFWQEYKARKKGGG